MHVHLSNLSVLNQKDGCIIMKRRMNDGHSFINQPKPGYRKHRTFSCSVQSVRSMNDKSQEKAWYITIMRQKKTSSNQFKSNRNRSLINHRMANSKSTITKNFKAIAQLPHELSSTRQQLSRTCLNKGAQLRFRPIKHYMSQTEDYHQIQHP